MNALEMALEALTNPSTIAVSHAIELIRAELANQTPNIEDSSQDWAKLDGAVAWHLIERHAENWADVGKMMDEYVASKLAKPEQEPVAYIYNGDLHWCEDVSTNDAAAIEGQGLYTAPSRKPEQDINILHIGTDVIEEGMRLIVRRGNEIIHSQFYESPKRQWVGLTDDEINNFDKKLRDNGDYCSLHFAWGISAKLKEKNT